MYGKLLAYLRDHRTRQDFYNFSEDSAALTSRDLTVFGYCVARGMEYLGSKKGIIFIYRFNKSIYIYPMLPNRVWVYIIFSRVNNFFIKIQI